MHKVKSFQDILLSKITYLGILFPPQYKGLVELEPQCSKHIPKYLSLLISIYPVKMLITERNRFIFFGKKNNFVLFTRKKKRKPKQSCCKRIIFKIKKLKIKILVLVHCLKFDQSFILYQTKYIFWSEKSFNQKNPSSKNIQVISFDKK